MSAPQSWCAVHTRSNHEKTVAARLKEFGLLTYLPVIREVRNWSDRKKVIESPLFGCYVFVQIEPTDSKRKFLVETAGVLRVLGNDVGSEIPNEQIESIRKMIDSDSSPKPCPFLKIGQRVRVQGGALDGIEGILSARNGENELVVSIEAMGRAISVKVDGYDLISA